MGRFNSRSTGTKTVNHGGGEAFKANAELELAMSSLTSFVSNKFYESDNAFLTRLITLCESVPLEFLGKLAVYVRKEANMRSISHVLLAEFARLHKGNKKYIEAGIQRVDDMAEIVAYYGFKYGKPIPNSIKKAIRSRISDFNAYQLGKYKMDAKDVKLVDLFNLVHPKPRDDVQAQMWGKVLKGELESPETWEVLISTAKNPLEGKAAWEKLILENKIGYMALLRNLRNLTKYKVSDEAKRLAAAKIMDAEEVKNSKQLPFRFLSAYKEVDETIFKDAISVALDISVENMPSFDGQNVIFVDVSGSMRTAVSAKSSLSAAEIGLLFGAALWKKNPNSTKFFTFDSRLYTASFSSRTPLIDIVNSVPVNGGSTDTWITFKYLTQEKLHVDNAFILSDNEGYGGNVNVEFEAYKRAVNPNVKLYAIDLMGYGHLQFPANNAVHLAGWSDKIFDSLKYSGQRDALVQIINDYEI